MYRLRSFDGTVSLLGQVFGLRVVNSMYSGINMSTECIYIEVAETFRYLVGKGFTLSRTGAKSTCPLSVWFPNGMNGHRRAGDGVR